MKTYFDHEKLDVYQESIVFRSRVGDLLIEITSKAAAKDHDHDHEREQERE
jgi:hypothetical protein